MEASGGRTNYITANYAHIVFNSRRLPRWSENPVTLKTAGGSEWPWRLASAIGRMQSISSGSADASRLRAMGTQIDLSVSASPKQRLPGAIEYAVDPTSMRSQPQIPASVLPFCGSIPSALIRQEAPDRSNQIGGVSPAEPRGGSKR